MISTLFFFFFCYFGGDSVETVQKLAEEFLSSFSFSLSLSLSLSLPRLRFAKNDFIIAEADVIFISRRQAICCLFCFFSLPSINFAERWKIPCLFSHICLWRGIKVDAFWRRSIVERQQANTNNETLSNSEMIVMEIFCVMFLFIFRGQRGALSLSSVFNIFWWKPASLHSIAMFDDETFVFLQMFL